MPGVGNKNHGVDGRFQRTLTLELAERFRDELLSDDAHSVNSAAVKVGLKPKTVHKALKRAEEDACTTEEDEQICDLLYAAKVEHVRRLCAEGAAAAKRDNRAGTSWHQWRLENVDPSTYGRKRGVAVELTGKDGGPLQSSTTLTVDGARAIRDKILFDDEPPPPEGEGSP